MQYIDDPAILSKKLESLELELSTIKANDAGSLDRHYVNIVFSDGTRLYEPENLPLYTVDPQIEGTLPAPGQKRRYKLPFKERFPNDRPLDRTLGDIAEVLIRKAGDDAWFVGSVLLFANKEDPDMPDMPLLGNSKANQFLDNDEEVLFLRDWSTGSLSVAPATNAHIPLTRLGYRVLGPVIGQVSTNSAIVLYRVDREGNYRFTVTDPANSNAVVSTQILPLEPTNRFEVNRLQADHEYKFDLSVVRSDGEVQVPDAAGSLRTYPQENFRGRFTLAFGSCANPDSEDNEGQVAQGAWLAIRALAPAPNVERIDPVRLFIHLGDTFYFYDDYMDEVPVEHVETMQAAHLSMRRNIEFLDVAGVVPCCGVWDDHDFAGCDLDSTPFRESGLLGDAVHTWLQYWGNQPINAQMMGLTTRISYGLVDIYLLDGRFMRDKAKGVCFGQGIIDWLLSEIDIRGANDPRVVVLATGSNWNHHPSGDEHEDYGDSAYDAERENLFRELASRMVTNGHKAINGLLLISGDNHVNEIFHVILDQNNGRMAPEFVSTPLTRNTGLSEGREIEGERVASFSSERYRGFATLTIDTSRDIGERWTATVRYYQEAGANNYESRTYVLSNGQFNLE